MSGPISSESNNPFSLFWYDGTNYNRYLTLLDNGTMGIGIDPNSANVDPSTPAPYKLLIGGKLGAGEIWCSAGAPWPDFVFDQNYRLKSFDELELYINTNKHLPGLPSSDEIEKQDKINLAEMQAMQLEKLEEAYLYILQLKKEIEELRTQIKNK